MELEEIIEALKIEDREDFRYFDTFCQLMELEHEVCEDVLMDIYIDVDISEIAELVDDYMEELMTGIPDDSMDMYTLFNEYKSSLRYLMRNAEEENDKGIVIGELTRFRTWYAQDMNVECSNMSTMEKKRVTICEAFVLARLEKLAEGKYQFDFTDVLDFEFLHCDEVDHFSDEDFDEEEETDESLIDSENPVIDGEEYEEEEEGELWDE